MTEDAPGSAAPPGSGRGDERAAREQALAADLAAVLGVDIVTGLKRLSGGASRETWAFDADGTPLILDANEGWSAEELVRNLDACAEANVKLVEQPLPAHADDPLASIGHDVPVCADESVHDRADLAQLVDKYDAVNVKLDKAGGLTEALALTIDAQKMGFSIMVGSMVSTSLGVAPALLLTPAAQFVDLDGPLLLAHDRDDALRYDGAMLAAPAAALWG